MAALRRIGPGLLLCLVVATGALGSARAEQAVLGSAPLEALVLAILLGACLRASGRLAARFDAGVAFSARTVLEVAVLLLGATIDPRALRDAGPALLGGIALLVVAAIAAGFGVGRLLGLEPRMAMLIACGNAICGNSAIAAVAPAIDAKATDVTTAISFTAVLGIAVVLALPLALPLLHMSTTQYGTFAGLTVYAVPQVFPATAFAGASAVQLGTLVKLARVTLLGPVVLCLGLLARSRQAGAKRPSRPLVPWFIPAFAVLAVARAAGIVPHGVQDAASMSARLLTLVAMAALGLSSDIRALAGAGTRLAASAIIALGLLGSAAFGLIRVLGLA